MWPNFLGSIESFSEIKITKEDLKNTDSINKDQNLYRQKKSSDETKYLKSIKLNPSILKLSNQNLSRASQLTLKTNQFNLTTHRYNRLLKKKNNNKKNIIKLISLKDIYGDHGIVGLYIVKEIDKNLAIIDTFLMSCRI